MTILKIILRSPYRSISVALMLLLVLAELRKIKQIELSFTGVFGNRNTSLHNNTERLATTLSTMFTLSNTTGIQHTDGSHREKPVHRYVARNETTSSIPPTVSLALDTAARRQTHDDEGSLRLCTREEIQLGEWIPITLPRFRIFPGFSVAVGIKSIPEQLQILGTGKRWTGNHLQ